MGRTYRKRVLSLVLTAAISLSLASLCGRAGRTGEHTDDSHGEVYIEMDYANARVLWEAEENSQAAEYVYVSGGYNDPDRGGTWPWGNTRYCDVFFIGDTAGELVLEYAGGETEKVPLIFGYTLWWREHWNQASLPFKGEGADNGLQALLKETLCLYGAFEGNEVCTLRIAAGGLGRGAALKRVLLADNTKKSGCPVITDVNVSGREESGNEAVREILSRDGAAEFFAAHTVNSAEPVNDKIIDALDRLCTAVTTGEADWLNAPVVEYGDNYEGPRIVFSGTPYANIATGVIEFSSSDIAGRIKRNGLFPESLDRSEQYIYGGIGTYSLGSAYGNRMYSRNKVVFALSGYGYRDRAAQAVNYVNKMLMYYPEHNITIFDVSIPGHMTMLVNDPNNYRSTGFPLTKYSDASVYGKDAWKLSNTEQDGHGLMMLSNYTVWKDSGGGAEWVNDNWKYINESAEWILWCFEHEDITFCKDHVLYAESEGCAGWMGYSLYCNEPCYFGLLAYAEMAETAGRHDAARRWRQCAAEFKNGILRRFTQADGSWDFSGEGKDRDPSLVFMSYLYGYDVNDMDQDFVERSRKSYAADLSELIETNDGYWGTWGTGYDHCTMLQNAMLFDRMDDATILMNNLSKICYAPRYPSPYGVPEAFAVDSSRNILRRTGDFENLVHTCEALLTYLVSLGVSPVTDGSGVLKVMPRLADGWSVSVEALPAGGTGGAVKMAVDNSSAGVQKMDFTLLENDGFTAVKYRLGPFPADVKEITVEVDGAPVDAGLFESGDRKWAWIELTAEAGTQHTMIARY